MEVLNLTNLDHPNTLEPDPRIWRANLDALRAEQPDFTALLENTQLPSHWRPVSGLDGWPTWRIEPAGAPPAWLANTAAPRVRAEGLIRLDLQQDKNPALPTIAAGAELTYLLEQLTHQQAVYVFEQNVAQLAAVLRLSDWTQAIQTGRCILIPPNDETAFLDRLLDQYPGLMPPGTLITLPEIDNQRIAELRVICERATQETSRRRNQRAARLGDRDVPPPASLKEKPSLAVLAFGQDRSTYEHAGNLSIAAEKIDWPVCCRLASGPREIHRLRHCEALADFAPSLAIGIGHPPTTLPLPGNCRPLQWHLHIRDLQTVESSENLHHLAASPAVAEALRQANIPPRQIHDFFWAIPESLTKLRPPSVRPTVNEKTKTVILFGDLPNSDAAACGISQPTHKQLWEQLHETASKSWDTSDILHPSFILSKAEQASRVRFSDPTLRERLLRIVEHILIPSVLLQTIPQRLIRDGFRVGTVGKGWQRCSNVSINRLADDCDRMVAHVHSGEDLADYCLPCSGAIFANPLDPLQPALFHAIALRLPLLIFNPDRKSLTERLGSILQPSRHYLPFANYSELLDATGQISTDPGRSRERCECAFDHVTASHTYSHRLTTLVNELNRPS